MKCFGDWLVSESTNGYIEGDEILFEDMAGNAKEYAIYYSKELEKKYTETKSDMGEMVKLFQEREKKNFWYVACEGKGLEIKELEKKYAETIECLGDFILTESHANGCYFPVTDVVCKCMDRRYYNHGDCTERARQLLQKHKQGES